MKIWKKTPQNYQVPVYIYRGYSFTKSPYRLDKKQFPSCFVLFLKKSVYSSYTFSKLVSIVI